MHGDTSHAHALGLVLGLVLAACGARPSPREPSLSSSPPPSVWLSPTGDLEVLYDGEARGVTAVAGALVLLAADGRGLQAIDLIDGALRWRLRLPRPPAGAHSLTGVGDRVLHHVANQLQVISADGRLLQTAPAPTNDPHEVALKAHHGACVFEAGCGPLPDRLRDGGPARRPPPGRQDHLPR